jgi:uncharacterized protein (DUF1330 family)
VKLVKLCGRDRGRAPARRRIIGRDDPKHFDGGAAPMPAYFLFDVHAITDGPRMEEYRSKVLPTVQKFGGRYLGVGGSWTTVEGSWKPTFPVLIEFPTIEHARRWYDSEEYRPLKQMRLGATRGDAILWDAAPKDGQ